MAKGQAVLRDIRRSLLLAARAAAFAAPLTATAVHASDDTFSFLEFKGLLDARGIISSSTQSWEDRGYGKTRYGGDANGDRRALGRIAEASLIAKAKIAWDLSAVVQLTATPEQRTVLDIVEAYVQYKPVPSSNWGFRSRVGAFFPPISLENNGLAWTSPYTITSSAINSWVGEELRTIGGEGTVFHRGDDVEVAITGALFKFNDPTGTLLAWRGWSFNDREAGLFDRLKFPIVRIIQPTGRLFKQQPFDQPFVEVDGRVGYYASASIDAAGLGKVSLLRYDNRADDLPLKYGQWSWNTTFWSLSFSTELPGDVELLAQGMTGKTTVVTTPVGSLVNTDFSSAYALISKPWGEHRLSFRADLFKTRDRDVFPDNNTEDGYALTLAYIYRPAPKQRLTLEVLYIDSKRPERTYGGFPARARESQFQVSYRFFL